MPEYVLYHHGVKGMKWGVRKKSTVKPNYGRRMVRGHGGPGVYFNKERRLAGDKRDLDYLNKGGHLSVGVTKKRQAALDARDKQLIEKRIAKNEQKLANRTPVEKARAEMREANKARNKAFDDAYDAKSFGFNATKKGREASKKRWDAAYEADSKARAAKEKFKSEKEAKRELKKQLVDTYKKIKSGEIQQGIDYDTGKHLGFYNTKTGKPVSYGDIDNAVSYARTRQARKFVAGALAVSAASFAARYLT